MKLASRATSGPSTAGDRPARSVDHQAARPRWPGGGGGHDLSRVPVHLAARDFQQAAELAEPGAEGLEQILDQQPLPAPAQPTGPMAGTAAVGGSGNPPPIPMQGLPAPSSPSATIPTRIRAATTPASMTPDRIPPNIDFPVSVSLANFGPPWKDPDITVAGAGGGNGTVTVNGAATTQLSAGGTVQLRGTAQTTPGNAGSLRLVVRLGGTDLASSNMFSVAAIPQDMALSGHTALSGPHRGMVVTQTWASDSGSLADLDEARISEAVQYVSSTGIFSGLGARNSGYIGASGGTLTDTHSTPVAALTGFGTRLANQTEMFLDNRTGVRDIPMRASGFVITRIVISIPRDAGGPLIQITTDKRGAAVTANGVASTAGAGSETETQNV